ncbi:endonuclease/exonuclease/phosphatase family protein [Microbacterium sp. NPDC057659]|uniref:endonuclease/exonuclease/phosphatase family protein n=1 Tax=Microbacterium sp. NPDC057659 TaxID=3346198 RepID=UPI003670F35B
MRRLSLSLTGIVAAWLLIDLWRLWTPSLITLFGRAAETPPEIMGAYALLVMALPLAVVVFVRRAAPVFAAWLLVAAFAVRLLLRMNPDGGDVQLYGSSLGVVLTASALCLAAGSLGRTLVPSVFLGVLLSAATHAMLGGYGAVWRSDAWDVTLLALQAVLLVFAVRTADLAPREPVSPRTALLLPPTLLLVLLALGDIGRSSTVETVWGPVVAVLGCGAAAVVALLPAPRRRPWISAVLFVSSIALSLLGEITWNGFAGSLPPWTLLAFLVGPAAAARLLLHSGPGRSPRGTALAAGLGSVLWAVLFFAYYAGYDLGYRADVALVAASVLVAGWMLAYRPGGPVSAAQVRASERRMDDSGGPAVAGVAIGAVAAAVLALVGPFATVPASSSTAQGDDLTVAAYNLRMGYGIDGRFDPVAVAAEIRGTGAQVVLLSEVDRGWLLNGGQDELAILARMLGMRAVFGPAADPVWGDAILTGLPVGDASSVKYPMFDALTGAGVTMATVDWNGTPVRVLATHLQPDGNETNATERAAQVFADQLGAGDGPVVGGGDLNTTPGSDAWNALLSTGAEDALAGIRPAPTSPADAPKEEIDHLLVAGLTVVDAKVVPSQLSDHLMIVTTLR